MVFMPRVNDPDWTTLQYSINDRITEDLDKYIFTIQNSLQNCVNVMIPMLWNLSFENEVRRYFVDFEKSVIEFSQVAK